MRGTRTQVVAIAAWAMCLLVTQVFAQENDPASSAPPPVRPIATSNAPALANPTALPATSPTPAPPSAAGATTQAWRAGDGAWALLRVLLVALICGGLGGFLCELMNLQGRIERPHRPEPEEGEEMPYAVPSQVLDLGVWARIAIGAGAAVAVLWLLAPASWLALISGSLVAGTAGSVILGALRDRMLAVIAGKEIDTARKTVAVVGEKLGEVQRALESATAGRPMKGTSFTDAGAELTSRLIDVARLVGEAQGSLARLAPAPGVGPRVREVLAEWSGVVTPILNIMKIVDLWAVGRNTPCIDANLHELIQLLWAQFPKSAIDLSPVDLRDEKRYPTVRALIDYVAARVPA